MTIFAISSDADPATFRVSVDSQILGLMTVDEMESRSNDDDRVGIGFGRMVHMLRSQDLTTPKYVYGKI